MFSFEETSFHPICLPSSPPAVVMSSTPSEYFSLSSPDRLSQSSTSGFQDTGTVVSIPTTLRGSRTPSGKLALARSRNLKEYEEEIDRLQKENVDLKIRIHLMEEKYGVKTNKFEENKLKTEFATLQMKNRELQKNLAAKIDLLRDASKVIDVLDNGYEQKLKSAEIARAKDIALLQSKIAQLGQKLSEGKAKEGALTKLCDLAFDPEESRERAFPHQGANAKDTQKGVFSVESSSSDVVLEGADRMRKLEDQVQFFQTRIVYLENHLEENQKASSALVEDVSNLKRELQDREEKVSDLEAEMVEKEQKVDHLMQDLETRHLEIEVKDTTIKTLHDDLNKVEPEIEVKVQQIIERDKLIEEKIEQLQQQNKILVEIQITLDEKQKQIAELEAQLRQEQQNTESAKNELNCTRDTMKLLLDQIDNENATLKKELKKKERKIRDLVAELKEALELVNKAKWEAETSGCEDGVKEMVEDENERLWAELEQKKLDLTIMKTRMETEAAEAAEKIGCITLQLEKAEENLKNLLKNIKSGGGGGEETNNKEAEILSLKEKIESREAVLRNQQSLLDSFKGQLSQAREELKERKSEMKEMKNLLLKNNAGGVNDLFTKQLLESALQGKLNASSGDDNNHNLELLKMFIDVKNMKDEAATAGPVVQVRSNSLSKLGEDDNNSSYNGREKNRGGGTSQPKSGRSHSFSMLENALRANMGQKVVNTNQTFNTYVLPSENEARSTANDLNPTNSNEKSNTEISEFMNDDCDNTKDTINTHIGGGGKDMLPAPHLPSTSSLVNAEDLQILCDEIKQCRQEAQDLRDERKIHIVSGLQRQPEDNCPQEKMSPIQEANVNVQLLHNFSEQVEDLKQELRDGKDRIAYQVLEAASYKYEESIGKYKQEIISLRKRLADSHNACDLLRTRLEELVDFMEQLIELERKGLVNLSHLSQSRRRTLQKTLDDSRALSQSLSHSLMIGTDYPQEETESSLFSISVNEVPEEIDLSRLTQNGCGYLDVSSDNQPTNLVQSILESEIGKDVVESIIHTLDKLNYATKNNKNRLELQSGSLISLQSELKAIQRELDCKDRLLLLCGYHEPSDLMVMKSEDMTSLSIANGEESNDSLHLSALQHSIEPLPEFSERLFHQQVFPASSSGSTVLPSDSFREEENDLLMRRGGESINEKCLEALELIPTNAPPATNLASPSESEAWSEPDRNVSLARIGLDVTNLTAASSNHDRSRSRTNNKSSAPFTSESDDDGEVPLDENRDGTPKIKKRSDAAEAKRLAVKLRNVEQMNENLKAELYIYQSISKQFSWKQQQPAEANREDKKDTLSESKSECSITIPSSLFQEIRSLRHKLEEAITKNDLLRDQLEAALSGYLNEETRNIMEKLNSAQHEIRLNQEQLRYAAAVEQQLKVQLKDGNERTTELNERLSHYLSSCEKLEQKVQILQDESKTLADSSSKAKRESENIRKDLQNKEKTIECQHIKIRHMTDEYCELTTHLERLKNDNKILEQQNNGRRIDYDRLQNEKISFDKNVFKKLDKDLQESQANRLKLTKENLNLLKGTAELESKIESLRTQSNILYIESSESRIPERQLWDKETQCNFNHDKIESFVETKNRNISINVSHSSDEDKNLTLCSERTALCSERTALRTKMEFTETAYHQLEAQMNAEKSLTKDLQLQNNNLKSKLKSLRRVLTSKHDLTRSLTSIESRENESIMTTRPSTISWKENKENRLPDPMFFGSDPKLFLVPETDDDVLSGDSPDLGIGSDGGQFSSLEMLNQRQKFTRRSNGLCSDPSHSRLSQENESLLRDRDALQTKLKATKETLNETLEQLCKANNRKESIEKSISRQLTKTHDVLRQASGNLRQIHKTSAAPRNST